MGVFIAYIHRIASYVLWILHRFLEMALRSKMIHP